MQKIKAALLFLMFFFVVFIFISFTVDQNKLVYKITRCEKSYRTIWLFVDLIRLEFYLSFFFLQKNDILLSDVFIVLLNGDDRDWLFRQMIELRIWFVDFVIHHFFFSYAPLQTNAHKHRFLLSRLNTSSFGHCSKCKQLPISNGFR